MRRSRPIMILLAILCGAVVLETGCSTTATRVRPWERSALADETMNPARDALGGALNQHVYFSREAASGGQGVGGSGCGCN